MTLIDLARQVREMRDRQKEYSRSRSDASLKEAKAAESRIDKLMNDIINPPQPTLFDGPPP